MENDSQKFIDRGLYPDLIKQSEMDFDYEVECIKLDTEENKIYFIDEVTGEKKCNKYIILLLL